MALKTRQKKEGESGKPWKVVDSETDQIIAECPTEELAKQSVYTRNRQAAINAARKQSPYVR